MNAHDAIALQTLLARVADLDEGLEWVGENGHQARLTPDLYLWKALAKGRVPTLAVDIWTGHATPVSPEVFMGSTAFIYDAEVGVLLFTEPFAPFSARWVAPTLGDLREAYERWQFRHEFDEDWTPLRRWLEQQVELDLSDLNVRLSLPLYFLAVEDPESAEQQVRNERAEMLGRSPKGPTQADPAQLQIATLSSKQVAAILHIEEQSLRRWRSEGKGPPFVKLEGQKIVYMEDAVREWMVARGSSTLR